MPDGRQVTKRVGPAYIGRGRAPAGTLTRRAAEEWLSGVLAQARGGTLPGMVRTGVTFAEACEHYLEWLLHERQRRPSTLRDYRSIIRTHLLPSSGDVPVEEITVADCEHWRAQLGAGGTLNNRTKVKIMTVFFSVMERARKTYKLPLNPLRDLEKPIQRRRIDIQVFSPEESWRSSAPPTQSKTPRST